jgi:hypothetical protein
VRSGSECIAENEAIGLFFALLESLWPKSQMRSDYCTEMKHNVPNLHAHHMRKDPVNNWKVIFGISLIAACTILILLEMYCGNTYEIPKGWLLTRGVPISVRVTESPANPRFPYTYYLGQCGIYSCGKILHNLGSRGSDGSGKASRCRPTYGLPGRALLRVFQSEKSGEGDDSFSRRLIRE